MATSTPKSEDISSQLRNWHTVLHKALKTRYYKKVKQIKPTMNNQPMNLYIINEVLSDYTSGMCVIAAESREHAREFFIEEFGEHLAKDFDEYGEFTIIEGVNHPAGVVQYVYGGG